MEIYKSVASFLSVAANLFTIVASSIAIFLFLTKRKELSAALAILLNWSYQTTLSEIVGKLDRLHEYNANEPVDISEIKNIFHEIAGQFRGNPRLLLASPGLPDRLELFASGKKLTEPYKRSMVAEVREIIRTLQVANVDFEGY